MHQYTTVISDRRQDFKYPRHHFYTRPSAQLQAALDLPRASPEKARLFRFVLPPPIPMTCIYKTSASRQIALLIFLTPNFDVPMYARAQRIEVGLTIAYTLRTW